MSYNEYLERALTQARELQKNVNELTTKANEQLQPLLKESIENAHELQTTLAKHATEFSAMSAEQAKSAVAHLQEFSRLGAEAAQKTAEQARHTLDAMAEQSKKVVDSVADAMKNTKDDHKHEG